MKPPFWFLLGLSGTALALSGTTVRAADDHGHDHGAEAGHHEADEHGDEVAFIPGRGLRLAADVAEALGLQLATASEQSFAPARPITAQVYTVAPRVLASARVPADHAAEFEGALFDGARLVQVDRSATAATSFVDLVFELPATPAHRPGDFVTFALTAPAAVALAVPHAAVLEGAAGPFVYVVDGEFLRRTPVPTADRVGDLVRVTSGLRAGDRIVTTAVDQLWLAELRLTKGGGHSH